RGPAGQRDSTTDARTGARDDDDRALADPCHGAITEPPSSRIVAPTMEPGPQSTAPTAAPIDPASGTSPWGGARWAVNGAIDGRKTSNGTSTALTRIPSPAHWRAADLAMALTPSTTVVNATSCDAPAMPIVGATTTMDPRPPASRLRAPWRRSSVTAR